MNKLDQKTKDLMHIVMDNEMLLLPIMHQLSRYKDRAKILKWLMMSNLRGKNLLDWIKIVHQNSVLGMVKYIIKFQNKDRELRPIIMGRDWVK